MQVQMGDFARSQSAFTDVDPADEFRVMAAGTRLIAGIIVSLAMEPMHA